MSRNTPDLSSSVLLPETPLHREIRDALRETTDRLAQEGVRGYLMGGIGACSLTDGHWPEDRPLSRDLDFLVSDDSETLAILEKTYGKAFSIASSKPVFQSLKLQTAASNGVELDFIARSVVVLPEGTLTLSLSPLLEKHARQGSFLGEQAAVLPPEAIVLQKLFAGRSQDLGKFDLQDARTLLEAHKPDTDLIKAILQESVQDRTDPATLHRITQRILSSLVRADAAQERTLLMRSALSSLLR